MESQKSKVASGLSENKIGTKLMISGDNPSRIKRTTGHELINSEGEKIVQRKQFRSSSFTQENNRLASIKMNMSESNVEETSESIIGNNTDGIKHASSINTNEFGVQMNQLVLQAALGSCRWPPFLLVLWVVILVLSHVMYSLLNALTLSLPLVKKFCQHLRSLTVESWLNKNQTHRKLMTGLLFVATVSLYSIYFVLYALHVSLLWFLESPSNVDCNNNIGVSSKHDVKITNYDEIVKV